MEHTFGERLKKYRQEKRLTQQELADLLGVSNKTVSRWESDGGFPDVPLLVPLARALGVTVDDLLDGERPVRDLTKRDWQSLLSFAFALGGGVLFFLLDLFMPAALCWLAYMVCMAYGVYLQKYYTYQNRWFLLANAVMDLSVNLTLAGSVLTVLAGVTVTINVSNADELWRQAAMWLLMRPAILYIASFLAAVVLTAVTQYFLLKWMRGEALKLPSFEPPRLSGLRLGLCRPTVRKLLPILIPVAVTLFWYATGQEGLAPSAYLAQSGQFKVVIALCALFCLAVFWKKGCRGMLLPAWGLTALCARYHLLAPITQKVISKRNRNIFDYEAGMNTDVYIRFTQWGKELAILAVLAGVLYLIFCVLHIYRKPAPAEE